MAATIGLAEAQAQNAAADEYEAAFQEMLVRPAELERSLRFARLAVGRGEYETAVGVFERVLLISPDLPAVRAELGALYYRLRSYDIARLHLEQALASGRLPEANAARARNLLAQAEQQTARSLLTGSVTLGGRYQSNANFGTSSSLIRAGGVTLATQDNLDEEDDFNLFGAASLTHRYDLRTQNRAAIETDALLFATRQIEVDENDLVLLQIAPGIRFQPAPESNRGLSLRPYLLGQAVGLGGDYYSTQLGGGLQVRQEFGEAWRVDGFAQYLDTSYENTGERPNASGQDGHETSGGLVVRYRPASGTVLSGRFVALDRAAEQPFHDYVQYALTGRVDRFYADPSGWTGGTWASSLFATRRYRNYGAPDPVVDPAVSREDREWLVGIGHAVFFDPFWSVNAEVAYAEIESNLPNFERDNLRTSLSVTRRF